LLLKSENDIANGWTRLRVQEGLLRGRKKAGLDTQEAERLAELFKQTLVEWERHQVLIRERVAYLERTPYPFLLWNG
jgi:hypothetical protein